MTDTGAEKESSDDSIQWPVPEGMCSFNVKTDLDQPALPYNTVAPSNK